MNIFNKITNYIISFPFFILIAALLVSCSAAFYSVYGLSKLFAGASTAVIIMAGSLEFSKLVITASLHKYWGKLNPILKIYLSIGTLILVLITSSGIYGFLSDAYQQTADKDKTVTRKVQLLESKKDRFVIQLNDIKKERESISSSISQLRTSLGTDNQTQMVTKSGKVLTQIKSTNKKGVKSELDASNEMNNLLFQKIEALNDSIATYELRIIEFKSRENVSELGPLKYLSNLTGSNMDTVVNWFLMLLMLVFDPLAIALVLTALFAFNQRFSSNESTPTQNTESTTPNPIEPAVEIPIEVAPEVRVKRKYTKRQKPNEVISESQNQSPQNIEVPVELLDEIDDLQPNDIIETEIDSTVIETPTQNTEIESKVENIETNDENLTETSIEVEGIEGSAQIEPEVKPSTQLPTEKKVRKSRPSKRKVVDNNLTPDIVKHLSESLSDEKKNKS